MNVTWQNPCLISLSPLFLNVIYDVANNYFQGGSWALRRHDGSVICFLIWLNGASSITPSVSSTLHTSDIVAKECRVTPIFIKFPTPPCYLSRSTTASSTTPPSARIASTALMRLLPLVTTSSKSSTLSPRKSSPSNFLLPPYSLASLLTYRNGFL